MDSTTLSLNSDVMPVQTGGAINTLGIICILLLSSSALCIAMLAINNWKLDTFFEKGPTVGILSGIIMILTIGLLIVGLQVATTPECSKGFTHQAFSVNPSNPTAMFGPTAYQSS